MFSAAITSPAGARKIRGMSLEKTSDGYRASDSNNLLRVSEAKNRALLVAAELIEMRSTSVKATIDNKENEDCRVSSLASRSNGENAASPATWLDTGGDNVTRHRRKRGKRKRGNWRGERGRENGSLL